jgi:hypothetical protein
MNVIYQESNEVRLVSRECIEGIYKYSGVLRPSKWFIREKGASGSYQTSLTPSN